MTSPLLNALRKWIDANFDLFYGETAEIQYTEVSPQTLSPTVQQFLEGLTITREVPPQDDSVE